MWFQILSFENRSVVGFRMSGVPHIAPGHVKIIGLHKNPRHKSPQKVPIFWVQQGLE